MDLLGHLAIFRANWWKILIVASLVGAMSYELSQSHPQTYAADQLMKVATSDQSALINRSQTQVELRDAFYVALGNSRLIAGAVRTNQRLTALSVAKVQSDILVFETATVGIIEVSATGRTTLEAARIASGVSAALGSYVTSVQTAAAKQERARIQAQIASLTKSLASRAVQGNASVTAVIQQELDQLRQSLIVRQPDQFGVTPLTGPVPRHRGQPISPHPQDAGLLGFLIAAIFVGEGAVVTRVFKDRFARTKEVDQIVELTGLPVLAMVPHGKGPNVLEAFRTLRTNLLFLEGAGRPRTVAIVSPNPGAGKSFAALHLAESALAVEDSVVLVDADLRRPVLHARLHSDREPGLSNALRGADLESTRHRVRGFPNLELIPSGSAVNDTVGVLGGRAFRHVLDSLDAAGLVVVDTPPGSVYADAMAVAAQCDATLLVLDTRTTRRRAARALLDSLERTGATVIGVVVNNAQIRRRDTYEGEDFGRLRLRRR